MNQIFAGGIALIVTFFLWRVGKKTKLNSTVYQDQIPNLSESKSRLLNTINKKNKNFSLDHDSLNQWSMPSTEQKQIALRKKLFKLISAGPEERLEAVSIASAWGHPSILPILRRGLKDSDSRIVLNAAIGIEKHKRGSKNSRSQESSRPPRNVFLMR